MYLTGKLPSYLSPSGLQSYSNKLGLPGPWYAPSRFTSHELAQIALAPEGPHLSDKTDPASDSASSLVWSNQDHAPSFQLSNEAIRNVEQQDAIYGGVLFGVAGGLLVAALQTVLDWLGHERSTVAKSLRNLEPG